MLFLPHTYLREDIMVRQTTRIGPQLTRRRFLGLGLAAITAAPVACTSEPKERNDVRNGCKST